MAAKKASPNRLGSDPFGWIRDTRDEVEEEAAPQAPAPAPKAPAKANRPAAPKAPTAQPAQARQKAPVTAQAQAPTEIPKAPAQTQREAKKEPVEALSDNAVAQAIAETQQALSPQEIQALAALLQQAKGPAKRGRPRTNFREVTKSSQEGLPENWTRATFIVRESHLETLKDYAYTQRMTIRDALDQALEQYLEDKQVIARRVRGEE